MADNNSLSQVNSVRKQFGLPPFEDTFSGQVAISTGQGVTNVPAGLQTAAIQAVTSGAQVTLSNTTIPTVTQNVSSGGQSASVISSVIQPIASSVDSAAMTSQNTLPPIAQNVNGVTPNPSNLSNIPYVQQFSTLLSQYHINLTKTQQKALEVAGVVAGAGLAAYGVYKAVTGRKKKKSATKRRRTTSKRRSTRKSKRAHLVKGSHAAKRHMAKLRRMRKY